MQTWDEWWRFKFRDLSQSINHRLLKTSWMCTYIGWHSIFEIISVRLMMLFVAKDFHINVLFLFALTVYFDSVQWYRSHLRFIFIAKYDWKMRCIQNQVVSKRGAIIVTCNIAPTIIYSQPSIEVSITCHLLLLLAHEPSCKLYTRHFPQAIKRTLAIIHSHAQSLQMYRHLIVVSNIHYN